MRVDWRASLAVLLGSVVFACGATTPEAEEPEQQVTGVAKGADLSRCEFKGREDRIAHSTRGPGAKHPNIFKTYEVSLDSKKGKRILRCRQVDTNLDGIRDVIRTYTDDGQPLDEQSDTDYDGQIDTWIRFSRGRVLRESRDRNRDGRPDEYRLYSNGRLSRLQRDSDFDGKLDRWQVYDGERLHRVGVDLDGDQRVDRWYRDAEMKRLQEAEEEAGSASAEGATPSATASQEPAPGQTASEATPKKSDTAAAEGAGEKAPSTGEPKGNVGQ